MNFGNSDNDYLNSQFDPNTTCIAIQINYFIYLLLDNHMDTEIIDNPFHPLAHNILGTDGHRHQ